MTDIVERLRSGELCGEDRCRVMDEAGGCTCAIAAAEITRLRAENERLRWMVRRLQERTRQLIQDNKLLAHDDTAEWGLEELMKDVGDSNE